MASVTGKVMKEKEVREDKMFFWGHNEFEFLGDKVELV